MRVSSRRARSSYAMRALCRCVFGQWQRERILRALTSTLFLGANVPFMRLKVNVVSDNSMSSEVTSINCSLGAIHMKYDRLLESRFIEMFETSPADRAKLPRRFGSHSGPAHEFNLNLTCPQLSCELRFQVLEVANLQRKLRPDTLTVSSTAHISPRIRVNFCSLEMLPRKLT